MQTLHFIKPTTISLIIVSLLGTGALFMSPTQAAAANDVEIRERLAALITQLAVVKARLASLQDEFVTDTSRSTTPLNSTANTEKAYKFSPITSQSFPETNLKQSCFDLVWSPDEKWVSKSTRWYGDGKDRISYTAHAPGNVEALVSQAVEGVPAALAALKYRIPETSDREPVAARIMASVFIPEDHGFNLGNAKMPLGIWGGDPDRVTCIAGGCPPPYDPEYYPLGKDIDKTQNGFSVRFTRKALDKKTDPITHGPKIYSYNLNRVGVATAGNKVFGQSTAMSEPFPTGDWFRMVMDVRLNSFPKDADGNLYPKENGSVDMYMYDANDDLLGEVHQENLIFRDDPSWFIKGPLLADLWGGDFENDNNRPTKSFDTYYRDYAMYILKEGKLPSQCKQ